MIFFFFQNFYARQRGHIYSQGPPQLFGYLLLTHEHFKIWQVGLHSYASELKPIKKLEKRERGYVQGLSNFWVPPSLLSQEQVNLQNLNFVRSFMGYHGTSNFVGTFIWSIGTKSHEKMGKSSRGRSQGVPKIVRAPIWGALRGHLCDSTAFLLEW